MLTKKQVAEIMEQAQVFASAWSLVGGVFDNGNALEAAEQEKANLEAILAAHSAGAQEPVRWEIREQYDDGNWSAWMICSKVSADHYKQFPNKEIRPLYTHPQPMPQTNAARDAEDAKRYRFIKSQMKVGAVQTQLPLYRTLHWIGYEDCSDVRNADAAIDAEIERLDRAKGE